MMKVMMLIAVAITMLLTVNMMKARKITMAPAGSAGGPAPSLSDFNASAHPETMLNSPEIEAAKKAAALQANPERLQKIDVE